MRPISTSYHKLAIAPMLDWTDRHCRYMLRQLSKHTTLYTEMVTTGALLHNSPQRFLQYHRDEQPVVLQLGGNNPKDLAQCAQMAEDFGYTEVNLNVGCPSNRVQNGRFGACLMAEPQLVADCIHQMQQRVSIPVTVKSRIGIDDQDQFEHLQHFIDTVKQSGCQHFIIHARKAHLQGLNPKQNRTIPPLKYHFVHDIKQLWPQLQITINGGIETLAQAQHQLEQHQLDGVMIGRAAYLHPMLLAQADQQIYQQSSGTAPNAFEVVERMRPYIISELQNGALLHHITRHMINLFQNQAGAKKWRRHLSTYAPQKNAGIEVLDQALQQMLE